MYRFCTILLLLLSSVSISQEGNISGLLAQAEDVLYSDPQEAIRIAEYISEKSDQPAELLQAAYLLTRGFYIEGKYNQALKIGMKFSEEELKSDLGTQIQLNILLSKLLKDLEINSLAVKYSDKAKNSLKADTDSDTQNWVTGKIIQYGLEKNQKDSLPDLDQFYSAKSKFNKITSSQIPFQIGNIDLDLAEMHLRESQLDSAEVYLSSAFRESKKEKSGNYLEMKTLIKYGEFLFLKNAHAAAIDTLNAAMLLAQKFSNLPEQNKVAQAISENYLALNNLEEFNNYNQRADEINTAVGDAENDAVNTAYNIFNRNETERFSLFRANARWHLLILGGILLLLLLFWGFTKLRYRARINQYRKFIGYLEKRKEPSKLPALPKIDTSKTLNIPKETEEQLLVKLEEFENSLDFINKEISLSRMALQFETNTKYLSELINAHKQKNFNTYINELRINYITDKLKNDPQYLQYKISYLAEESGFSSHSVFATIFKSVTGISPTTFIDILQNKQESPAA
ncbi:helix-turn-helix domain-containing protein [Aequorivita todarodis]|uniref:helix-turn-helix domain-containing protein n=1 Tax=Aequorivita todarodis TaxID=2036821 RepID=UPI0023500191|nr:helix-turn-helix domain-containing protein [Aequorivita todarodis]MDC8000624.1 helix-turn-helix domain-containing protein [Aequorivita todarodis]